MHVFQVHIVFISLNDLPVCHSPQFLTASGPVAKADRPEGLPSRQALPLHYRVLSVVYKEKSIHLTHLDFSDLEQITIHRQSPIRSIQVFR